jgi:hypothetical protein
MTTLTLRDLGFVGGLGGADSDPYFANVSLLLHGNGADGSTAITDSSPSPKTVTTVGGAQISTAQSKFGGSSIAFDGSGDYLTLDGSNSFAFGAGDFSVEFWIYPLSLTGIKVIFDSRALNFASIQNRLIVYTSNASLAIVANDNTYINGTLSLNAWNFIAVCRSGGSLRGFLNGTQVGGTITDSSNYSVGASRPILGADGNSPSQLNYNGYIDELRITKAARYTADFTVPTAPFPDF